MKEMKRKILIGSIFAALLMLSMPFVLTVQAPSTIGLGPGVADIFFPGEKTIRKSVSLDESVNVGVTVDFKVNNLIADRVDVLLKVLGKPVNGDVPQTVYYEDFKDEGETTVHFTLSFNEPGLRIIWAKGNVKGRLRNGAETDWPTFAFLLVVNVH